MGNNKRHVRWLSGTDQVCSYIYTFQTCISVKFQRTTPTCILETVLQTTVKFLNFRTPENFAVIYLKFKQRPNFMVFCPKDANEIANGEDPDLGLHCLPRAICSKT